MNHFIAEIGSYPFDKLRNLLSKVSPDKKNNSFINLSVGEPQKNSNPEVLRILNKNKKLFSQYPPMDSIFDLTSAYKDYLSQRFDIKVLSDENILNLGGTREGTFSVIQSLFNREMKSKKPYILMPNPFYQIYGGASLLAGGISKHINLNETNNFSLDLDSIKESTWKKCQILVLCSPSNPAGSVMSEKEILKVIKLSRKYGFYIVSDECYVDIYRNNPPKSLIEVSFKKYGNFKNILSLHSLSKRSNLPGFRSGMICGDKILIKNFKKYRSFHGVSIPIPIQMASCEAWRDEKFVIGNRDFYNENFYLANKILDYKQPEGAFYMWLETKNGENFSKKLYKEKNIVTLPGKYLAVSKNGKNPAENYVRIALVHNRKIVKEALEKISDIL
tara:strand:- start:1580 stop:2746 length:1167 start_codon:yes stop_codon:yes gene_type:complete